jgi:flagellar motor component MotA
MRTRVIAALSASALLVGLGVGLSDGTDASRVVSVPLTVLGGATGATTVSLWAAAALGLAGRTGLRRPAASRLDALRDVLVAHAEHASAGGRASLRERTLPGHVALWRLGAELVGSGRPAGEVRSALAREAEAVLAHAAPRRERLVRLLRLVPVVALCLGLATAVWMVGALAWPREMGTEAALGLLGALYGSFAVAALSQEAGDRAAERAVEAELASAMVIETFVALAAGDGPSRLRARLDTMLGARSSAGEAVTLRAAA